MDSEIKTTKKNPSIAENLGKAGIEIGNKLGKVATEFFMGKQPTKEEKEAAAKRKERLRELKSIQEEAEYRNNLELARRGQYVPPAPVVNTKKVKKAGMFDNIGKYNPTEGFNLGTNKPDITIGGLGSGNSSKQPDFGLDGFAGSVNPIKTKNKEGEFNL